MKFNRRKFLKSALRAGLLAAIPEKLLFSKTGRGTTFSELDAAASAPVLKRDLFHTPVLSNLSNYCK